MRPLILGLGVGFPISPEEELLTAKRVGFDGVFTGWSECGSLTEITRIIRREGMRYQSVHAPFGNVHKLWEEGDAGEEELKMQIECLEDCARAEVPIAVMHAIIGFDRHAPNALGSERFGRIFRRAGELGISVAVENTEGEEYLERLLCDHTDPHVGFCIDTGHELCYNEGRDMIGKYASRLIATHLNDNLGVTGEEITWHDDAHLLPFDGVADWTGIAARLKKAGYAGELTTELIIKNKPNRHTHDKYAALSPEEYLKAACERLLRLRTLLDGE